MRKHLFPLVIILLAAIGLAPLLRDFIRETVVIPLLYIVWIGRLVFEAIPQTIFWGCFLGIALLLAIASLLRLRKYQSKLYLEKIVEPGRVETWAKLIRQASQENYYQWRLAQPLRELILKTLAHEARLPVKEIKLRLMADQLELPPEIHAYLQASLKSFTYLPTLRFSFRSRRPASPLSLNAERLVQFLEERSR